MSSNRLAVLGIGFVASFFVGGALLLYLFGTQTHTGEGRVAGIKDDGRTLVVEHEEITHNLTTALIGPEGRVRPLWRGNDWTPADIRQAVAQVVEPS